MKRLLIVSALLLASCSSSGPPPLEAKPGLEGHRSPIGALSASKSGDVIATRGGDGTIRLWKPGETKPHRVLRPEGIVSGKVVRALEKTDAPGLPRLAVPTDQILAVAPDGHELVASVIDPPAWQEEINADTVRRSGLAFVALPDGAEGDVWLFEPKWGAPTLVAWSPDGSELAIAFADSKIRIFTRRERAQLAELATFKNRSQPELTLPVGVFIQSDSHVVRALAFSPDGATLAAAVHLPTGGVRGHLVLWRRTEKGFVHDPGKRAPGEKTLGDLVDPDAPTLSSLAFSPDGKIIACSGYVVTGRQRNVQGVIDPFALKKGEIRGRVWVLQSSNGALLKMPEKDEPGPLPIVEGDTDQPVYSVGFASDDTLVLAAFGSLRLYSMSRRETLARRPMPASPECAYCPEEKVFRTEKEGLSIPLLAVTPRAILATACAKLEEINAPTR